MKIMFPFEEDSQVDELFQRGTIIKAPTPKRLQFTFPNNLLHFQRFQSPRHIQQEFQKQQSLASAEKRGLYVKKYVPNFDEAVRVYFKCKQCKAGLSFKRQNDYYKLLKAQVAHDHQLKQCKNYQKQFFLEYIHAHAGADAKNLKKRLKQQLNINESQYYYLRNIAEGVPANSFKFVQQYLKQRKFKIITQQSNQTDFPPRITVLSQKMLLNCQRYGDAIKIIYYDNNITSICGKKYGSVIVYGQDTNLRLIILAAALIQHYNTESVMGLLIDFFKLSGCVPECIATDQDPIICQAIKILRSLQIYNGLHVYDLQLFRQKIKHRLKSLISPQILQIKLQQQEEPFSNLRSYYKAIKALFKERNPQKGTATIILLEQQLKKEDLRTQMVLSDVLIHFVDTIEFTSIWKIPNGYIGFIQDIQSTITLTKDLSVIHFFKEIFKINKTIEARYQQKFKQHIQQNYKDARIKILRENLQRNILLIFLKQFRQAREQIEILQTRTDQFNINHSFKMANRYNQNETFQIDNWFCSCGFQSRTGIPCSHLLKGAFQVPSVKYENLFKQRWIKNYDICLSTPRARRGRPKKSRRNNIR